MDFGDVESECSSSDFFNIVHKRKNGFSQDAQYRSRKSPRKRPKVAQTSVSLVIDQLKSIFWCPGDFMSRIRTRRNWRSEFLMKYLRNNRCGCNKECDMILRYGKRNFVPEIPKIYSIGLRSGVRNCDSNDFSNSCGAIRNFKKRFSIVHRPIITCKYWVAQTTPTSSLSTNTKVHTNCQTINDCTKSTEISKYNQTQKMNHNSHHSQLYEHIEEKKSGIWNGLRNNRAFVSDDHSFMSGDFKDSSVTKDYKYNSPCMTRDAQIQTSNRKSLRRRKTRRSKSVTEKISRRKRYNNEPRIVADFHTARSRSSSRRNYRDEPWLRVRVLENKRAEYINKFTAVNRQIEEITATLRETCCDGENSRNNLENCDEYFSSISGDAKINTINWSDVESRSTIVRRRNTSREKNDLVNVKRITEELKSDRCKNVQEILHVDNLNNNETVSSPKETIASSRNPKKIPNDAFGHDSVRMVKETVCSANRISRNKTRAKCRYIKQMSFDLDLVKNQNEPQECSSENESFDKIYLTKTNFTILSNEHARNLVEGLANLKESRYCKIIEEKIDEVAVLENIKKRIDRDFEDLPAERSENDTEDFLTVSQKSSNLDRHDIMDVTSATTIEESEFTPLIVSNLESTETEIHNSMSTGAMSEYSNKNSTLSKYFSCTRIPSLISLTKNEDELAGETVDRSIIIHDSHSNLHSNYHYYDSCSNLSLNNCSFSNLDSSFDSSSNLECITHYDSSTQYIFPNKFLIGTANELYDTFEISKGQESFAKDKIREWEHPLFGESKRDKKEWQGGKRYTANSTPETSKSSKYIGSIDSGVFSSSLIDLYPAESSFHVGKTKFKKNHRAEKFDKSSGVVDSGSDSSSTDDTLDRKVNDVVKDLTKNLILCERKARMKLKARDARYSQHVLSRAYKFSRSLYDTSCDFLNSPRRSSEDERIVSISTPSLLSLSDSEIEIANRDVNVPFVNSDVNP